METGENKKLRKKLKALKGKASPILLTVAIIVVGSLVMKLIADSESRIDY